MANIIKLNVGGFRYETTLNTLSKEPSSMLASMFSGRHKLTCDKDDYYFIDRNGKPFEYILKYLRDGKINLDNASKSAVKDLVDEAEYYCLNGLVALLNRSANPDPNINSKISFDTIAQRVIKLSRKYYGCYTFYLYDAIRKERFEVRVDTIFSYKEHDRRNQSACPYFSDFDGILGYDRVFVLEANNKYNICVQSEDLTGTNTIKNTFNKFKKELGLS